MDQKSILIVEDEFIVAENLRRKLEQHGYNVVGVVATGKAALKMSIEHRPHLILMDIQLQGSLDGIQTTETIQSRYDVPVVYLTAHSDQATLTRAKLSGPLGYILKPYEDRELLTQIELALYRHQTDKKMQEQREWLRVILSSMGDAVVAANKEGVVSFINPTAEILTGWTRVAAIGKSLSKVFHIINERTRQSLATPMEDLLNSGKISDPDNRWLLVNQTGIEIPIWSSGALIHDKHNHVQGIVLVFRDISLQRQAEKEKDSLIAELTEAMNKVRQLSGLVPICASCKNIRDDKGYWMRLEKYIQEHSEATFSHAICPDCVKKLYPHIKLEGLE
ncbi:MAG: response regulator [Desulforhopalus sp.]